MFEKMSGNFYEKVQHFSFFREPRSINAFFSEKSTISEFSAAKAMIIDDDSMTND